MASFVLIRDHITGYYETVTISSEEQLIAFDRYDDPEPLLMSLQSQPMFRGVTRWADMEMNHYHALLSLHLSLLADEHLEIGKHVNSTVVRSLRTILSSLVCEFELLLDGIISQITIHRVSETLVQIDLSASIHGIELPKAPPGLKVIVDNS